MEENKKIKQCFYLMEKAYQKLNTHQFKSVKLGKKESYSTIINNLIIKHL